MTFLGLCPCPSVHIYSRAWAVGFQEPVQASSAAACFPLSAPAALICAHFESQLLSSAFARDRPLALPCGRPRLETPPALLSFCSAPKVSPRTSQASRDEGWLSAVVHHELQHATQGRSEPYCASKENRRPCPGGGRARGISQAASADGPPGSMPGAKAPRFQATPQSERALRGVRVHTDMSPSVTGKLSFDRSAKSPCPVPRGMALPPRPNTKTTSECYESHGE